MRNLSSKLYRIYACYTNITLYDIIYSIRYYPRFSTTAVGLGTYYTRIRRSTCTRFFTVSIRHCVLHAGIYTSGFFFFVQRRLVTIYDLTKNLTCLAYLPFLRHRMTYYITILSLYMCTVHCSTTCVFSPNLILDINPLNNKLNPICHLLALLGAHDILHISRIRVNIV